MPVSQSDKGVASHSSKPILFLFLKNCLHSTDLTTLCCITICLCTLYNVLLCVHYIKYYDTLFNHSVAIIKQIAKTEVMKARTVNLEQLGCPGSLRFK